MFISVINILLLAMMILFNPQVGYAQLKIGKPNKAIKNERKVSLKTKLPPFKGKAPEKKAKTNLVSGLPAAPNQGGIHLTSPPKKHRGNFKHPKKDSLHGPLNPRKRISWSTVTNGTTNASTNGRKLRKTKVSQKGATKTINQQPLPPKANSKQIEINKNSNTTKKNSKNAKKQ